MPDTVGCIDVPKPRVVAYHLRAGGDHRLAYDWIRGAYFFFPGRGDFWVSTAQFVSCGLCFQVGSGFCHRPPHDSYRSTSVPKMDGFARPTRVASHGISAAGHRVVPHLGQLSRWDARHTCFWPVAPANIRHRYPPPVGDGHPACRDWADLHRQLQATGKTPADICPAHAGRCDGVPVSAQPGMG